MEVVVLVPPAAPLPLFRLLPAVVLQQPHAVLRVLAALLEERGEVQVAAALTLFQFRWPRRRDQQILVKVRGRADVGWFCLALLPLRDDIVLGCLPELDAEDGLGAGSIRGQLAHLGTVGVEGGELGALRGGGGGVVG